MSKILSHNSLGVYKDLDDPEEWAFDPSNSTNTTLPLITYLIPQTFEFVLRIDFFCHGTKKNWFFGKFIFMVDHLGFIAVTI